jgi:hypothetical protein
MSNKIVRTICYFTKEPVEDVLKKLDEIEKLFIEERYLVQTKRLCSSNFESLVNLDKKFGLKYIFSVGQLNEEKIKQKLTILLQANNIHFNLDLSNREIKINDIDILY